MQIEIEQFRYFLGFSICWWINWSMHQCNSVWKDYRHIMVILPLMVFCMIYQKYKLNSSTRTIFVYSIWISITFVFDIRNRKYWVTKVSVKTSIWFWIKQCEIFSNGSVQNSPSYPSVPHIWSHYEAYIEINMKQLWSKFP